LPCAIPIKRLRTQGDRRQDRAATFRAQILEEKVLEASCLLLEISDPVDTSIEAHG
jgi:hypothetical protein